MAILFRGRHFCLGRVRWRPAGDSLATRAPKEIGGTPAGRQRTQATPKWRLG
jgi:hypothetical protein